MSEHGEPWDACDWDGNPSERIRDYVGSRIGAFGEHEDARRAAACVNALAHVPGDPGEYVKALEEVAKWAKGGQVFTADVDEALDKLDALRGENDAKD